MKNKHRIFLTGATGLVGSYIARSLIHDQFQVTALRRKESDTSLLGKEVEKIHWVEGDILDVYLRENIHENDIIVHCAAVVSFNDADNKTMLRTNIEGTANLVNIALEKNVHRFIHMSSVSAIGKTYLKTPITEQTEYLGAAENSPYSVSKHFSEREVWRGAAEGLAVTVLNPTIVLGAGFWHHGSPALVHNVANVLPYYPKGSTGFVDVRDVVNAVRQVISKDYSHKKYILNGFNMTYQDFFGTLSEVLNVKKPTKALPDWMAFLFWNIEKIKSKITGVKPIVTKHSLSSSRHSQSYDATKSKDELQLKYTEPETTISDLARSYTESTKQGYSIWNTEKCPFLSP